MKIIIMQRTAAASTRSKDVRFLAETFNKWFREGRARQVNNEYYVWQQQ